MNDKFGYYLEKLRNTKSEDALFSLIHLDETYIPRLIEAYQAEKDTSIQALLVEIIWQHRSLDVLDFLGRVLQHPDPKVWKNALDGFVALPNTLGISLLKAEKQRLLDSENKEVHTNVAKERIIWIDEAIEQINQELS